MYSTFTEGKSVVAERFIYMTTIRENVYFNDLDDIVAERFIYMTTIRENVYFNDLDDIVDKYTVSVNIHSSIKIKPKDVADDSFVEYSKRN